jgi:hypothetical protein
MTEIQNIKSWYRKMSQSRHSGEHWSPEAIEMIGFRLSPE